MNGTIKDILDVVMGIACCAAAFCTILLAFILDSTGHIPYETVVMIRAAWVVLIVSGFTFIGLTCVRFGLWLYAKRRGVKLGIMTQEEICAACRRMRG